MYIDVIKPEISHFNAAHQYLLLYACPEPARAQVPTLSLAEGTELLVIPEPEPDKAPARRTVPEPELYEGMPGGAAPEPELL